MHESVVLTNHNNRMVSAVHSDEGYLNESNTCNREGRHHYLSENVPPPNSAILNVAEIVKQSCNCPLKLNWVHYLSIHAKQSKNDKYSKKWVTHNHLHQCQQTISVMEGIINSRVQPKCTKDMDMQFHLLHNQGVSKKQLRFFWRPRFMNYKAPPSCSLSKHQKWIPDTI